MEEGSVMKSLTMNPVFYDDMINSSNGNIVINGFPEFVRKGSRDEVKNPKEYTELPSKIMYKDTKEGKGDGINHTKHKVHVSYYRMTQGGKTITKGINYGCSPEKLAKDLGVKEFGDALQGMKTGGVRMIIIPPELSNCSEYRVVQVTLDKVDHKLFSLL